MVCHAMDLAPPSPLLSFGLQVHTPRHTRRARRTHVLCVMEMVLRVPDKKMHATIANSSIICCIVYKICLLGTQHLMTQETYQGVDFYAEWAKQLENIPKKHNWEEAHLTDWPRMCMTLQDELGCICDSLPWHRRINWLNPEDGDPDPMEGFFVMQLHAVSYADKIEVRHEQGNGLHGIVGGTIPRNFVEFFQKQFIKLPLFFSSPRSLYLSMTKLWDKLGFVVREAKNGDVQFYWKPYAPPTRNSRGEKFDWPQHYLSARIGTPVQVSDMPWKETSNDSQQVAKRKYLFLKLLESDMRGDVVLKASTQDEPGFFDRIKAVTVFNLGLEFFPDSNTQPVAIYNKWYCLWGDCGFKRTPSKETVEYEFVVKPIKQKKTRKAEILWSVPDYAEDGGNPWTQLYVPDQHGDMPDLFDMGTGGDSASLPTYEDMLVATGGNVGEDGLAVPVEGNVGEDGLAVAVEGISAGKASKQHGVPARKKSYKDGYEEGFQAGLDEIRKVTSMADAYNMGLEAGRALTQKERRLLYSRGYKAGQRAKNRTEEDTDEASLSFLDL